MTREEFAAKLAELADGKWASYCEDVLDYGNGKIQTSYRAGVAGMPSHVGAASWSMLLDAVVKALADAKATCPTCGHQKGTV